MTDEIRNKLEAFAQEISKLSYEEKNSTIGILLQDQILQIANAENISTKEVCDILNKFQK